MPVIIYHNPRCSKSRKTLELLTARDVNPTIILYLESPPDAQKLKELLSMLAMTPRELMRKGETVYKEKGLGDENLSADQLISAMIADPILIERPIVVANGKAAIGRPPEQVLEIL